VPTHAASRLGQSAVAIQDPPLGTAHAVRAAENALKDFNGDIAIMYADAPLLHAKTLRAMFDARKDGLAVLAFEAADPFGYGRIVLGEAGVATRIVEQKDAGPEEQKIGLCNSGVICADKATLFRLLAQVSNENAKREYYLTDVVGLARTAAINTYVALAPETEVLGVNSRVELAQAETAFQNRARIAAMESGVTLINPQSVYFSYDTQIAPDVVVEPNC
jgi:bifunctional UDP-N-acetylglucosamine pyrophosphorylase / glucosamine-1-phosphate N-acetyltransferase